MVSYMLSYLTLNLSQKSDVSFAILASYAHDISWIHSFFEPSVPVIFITHGQSNKDTDMRYVLPNWIKITPKLGHIGCFHMKFMLVRGDKRYNMHTYLVRYSTKLGVCA